MTSAVRDTVLEYLAAHTVMTLATTGADGVWAAAVFYVNEGFACYFLSSPQSRHGRHLVDDPRVAATVQGQDDDWRTIRGVQMEGAVTRLAGADKDRAFALYGGKFPQVGDVARRPIEIAAALGRVSWYRLSPDRVYFVDNTKGFGHRDEVEL